MHSTVHTVEVHGISTNCVQSCNLDVIRNFSERKFWATAGLQSPYLLLCHMVAEKLIRVAISRPNSIANFGKR